MSRRRSTHRPTTAVNRRARRARREHANRRGQEPYTPSPYAYAGFLEQVAAQAAVQAAAHTQPSDLLPGPASLAAAYADADLPSPDWANDDPSTMTSPEALEETTLVEILLSLRDHLARAGHRTELASSPEGPVLRGLGADSSLVVSPRRTAVQLSRVPHEKWDEALETIATQMTSSLDAVTTPLSTAQEWRQAIRTRLVDPSCVPPQINLVARPFGGNLVLALYRRVTGGVSPVDSSFLADCPLSTEELFEAGQANTDDADLVRTGPIGAGAWAVYGEGFFTASKAANLDRLLTRLQLPAPHGAVIAVPHKHTVGIHPVDPADPMLALRSMCLFIQEEVEARVDPLLSHYVYYRAPDGTIETVGLHHGLGQGLPRICTVEAPRFDALLEAAGQLGEG